MGNENPSGISPADPPASASSNFIYLDQALWKQFREADTAEQFCKAWLALQCRFIGDATAGVVVLGEPDVGPWAPAAFWPDESARSSELSSAAEQALAERQSIVLNHGQSSAISSVAVPLRLDDHLVGVAAITTTRDRDKVRDVMRHLQWGVSWVELMLRRHQGRDDEVQRERMSIAFDMVAAVLEQERFPSACNALVTELAMRLECDPVGVGFVQGGQAKLIAMSHSARFGQQMNFVRNITEAMDEAIDQQAVVLYPARKDWEYRVSRAHADLVESHQAGSVLTVPLHSLGRVLGALTFERPAGHPFSENDVDLCDGIASVIGPVLEEKRLNDRHIVGKLRDSALQQLRRLLGPRYFGRKLATVLVGLIVVFFSLVTGNYRVTSPARLEGAIQRSIVAPFEGYLASQHARAGEVVKKSQLLATLDDRDLALERLRWTTNRHQRLAEYDRALAKQQRAEANIVKTQVEQADAQIALLDEQLARTRITAPFDGIIVSGDLSQSEGVAVQRGQELFVVAPLADHRVILEVDESDIGNIRDGQEGVLKLASLPGESLTYSVGRITPVAEQSEGRNYFRLEATLHAPSDRLRPGMEGIAKTEIDDRLLIRIWTEKLWNWLRLFLWQWLP